MESSAKGVKLSPLNGAAKAPPLFGTDPDLISASLERRLLPPLEQHDDETGTEPSSESAYGMPRVVLAPWHAGMPLYEGTIEEDFVGTIDSGNDVIQYYARYGHNARIKVFFLVRAHQRGEGSPYDLIPVPRAAVLHVDHHTITAAGVEEFFTDGSAPEYTPVGEWLREQSIFNLMQQMRFFKFYRLTRFFRRWRNHTHRLRFEALRDTCRTRGFVAQPAFCQCLNDVRGVCQDIASTASLPLEDGRVYLLGEFCAQQDEHRTGKLAWALETQVSVAQRSLLRVILEVTKQEAEVGREVAEFESDPSKGARFGKSTVKTRMRYMEKAQLHRVLARLVASLPNLVRMSDFMVVSALTSLVTSTLEDFHEVFKQRGLFRVHVELEPLPEDAQPTTNEDGEEVPPAGTQKFTPDREEVQRLALDALITGFVDLVKGVPRLLYNEHFTALFSKQLGRAPIGPDLPTLTLTSKQLNAARMGCERAISAAFKEAAEYARVFEDLRMIDRFQASWDAEEYRSRPLTVGQFRKDMALMRSWHQQVDALRGEQRCGMLIVDCSVLQERLHGIIEGALDTMRDMLASTARSEAEGVLETFQAHTTSMQQRPKGLHEFAGFLEQYVSLTGNMEQIRGSCALVEEMYEMLQSYEAKISEADKLLLDDMRDMLVAFTRVVDDASLFVEDKKESVIAELDAEVETLFEGLQHVVTDVRSGRFDDDASDPAETVDELERLAKVFGEIEALSTKFARYQELLSLDVTDFSSVHMAGRELTWQRNKWHELHAFNAMRQEWMTANTKTLDPEAIQTKVDEALKSNYKMLKMRKDDEVCVRTKKEIEAFKVYVPLLTELANPAIMDRHWTQIFAVVSQEYAAGETTVNAQDLVAWGVLERMEEVEAIAGNATKEFSMLKNLDKMEAEWEGQDVRCIPYKDSGTHIIGGTDDIQTILDDQIVKIQAMNSSPFIKPFAERAKAWEVGLARLQEILDNWLAVQATWLYLEPIFSSEDIVKQMPEEGAKFAQVDETWREMMRVTVEAPNVIAIAGDQERLDSLIHSNALLEEIQKGLAAYLEKKRLFFPRFFFLSNDDMLEILSETKDPTRVQPHLRKCFEGIDRLSFTEDLTITSMVSVEGEQIPFKDVVDTVKARGAVERWLLEVEQAMFDSVHEETAKGLAAYATQERHEWVLQWPGMVVLVVTATYWTEGVHAALADGQLAAYEEKCTSELLKIVDRVRGELTGLQRATLGALVVMDVHARDVCTTLVKNKVESDKDFEWTAQLRSYWEDDAEEVREKTVMMRMMSAQVEYGYEYLGNSSRLVITPLTDRCYRTLMGAIHMTLGGAPEGPAGTGKTETTKDLAKALARQCVVFNCSDQLDHIAMGKFFKGLASAGAWACFDEFNRINLEVLSVVAQQVLDIQRAIGARLTRFTFEGTELQLKWSAWASITMNPGYAGRSELPDNLKALFRTVAMMVPDYAMIAEIILFSYGYLKARESAKKIVQCYKLCSEQLSSQDHYDYGMRAVMAVLRAAGNLKRRYPSEDEFVLMLRSIIDVNLCKFLSQDVPLFQGIISDLFPGVVLPKADYDAMEGCMRDACVEMNLQPTPYFFLKCIQLYEMIIVRHGLMVVGLPFSGKTSSIRVLSAALTLMHERGLEGQDQVETHVINPKAVTMGQLYGQFDPVSHEWSDGVLAVKFRTCAVDRTTKRKWLILDGPVDAIWIENMNTVLDDNKKLCLNSGEIIQMSTNHTMMFEVMDLAVASPATVSRCGMVYLEPHQLGWQPLTHSWLAALPGHFDEEIKGHLLHLFNGLVPVCLRFVRREIKEASPTLDANLVSTLMRIFTSCADHLADADGYAALSPDTRKRHVEAVFLFSLVWSIGATSLLTDHRVLFGRMLTAATTGKLAGFAGPSGEVYGEEEEDIPEGLITLDASSMPLLDHGTSWHDWFFDPAHNKGTWRQWQDIMDDSPIPREATFRKIIVPTVDTVRYAYLLDLAVKHNQCMLLVGPTGTGKSIYIEKYISSLPAETYAPPIIVNFSARTTANMTQYMIDGKLDRRPPKRLGLYGPPQNKRGVVFVDDLNMPTKEEYGAQPPIELLRQWMDHGGWYDRSNMFRTIKDVLFVAAMGPPGGGRTEVTARYMRHFNTVAITEADDPTLHKIFGTIMEWFVARERLPDNIAELSEPVVTATMDVYKKVANSLLPTPTKSHYTFNLRDISRVVQGLILVKKDTLPTGDAGKQYVTRLWMHETLRIFYDRLTDAGDRTWFLDYLKPVVQERFGYDCKKLLAHLLRDGQVNTEALRRMFFGDFMDENDDPAQRRYVEVKDVAALTARMEEHLVDYNAMSKRPMNLAIFLYACEHLSRICRVLKQPGAHMLNVGVGGSGRQSLSRLAANISGMETFQIEISKSYTMTEWREDLKRITRAAGGQGKPSVFLFSDTQIKQESFVEDINNLLNVGEVPNMFPYDERSAVREECRVLAKKEGVTLETEEEQWRFFIDKTKENLHVVLCFSPVGDAFRERLRQFPSLVNCCTINWFTEWPDDALEAVATKFLAEVDLTAKQRTDVTVMCKTFHKDIVTLSDDFKRQTGRFNYVTPTSYLELFTMFKMLLGSQREKVASAQKRYEIGLEKLNFAADQVAAMQKELQDLIPVLNDTVAETEQLMAQVAKEKTEVVEPKKAVVDVEVQKASVAAEEANSIKQECEDALAEAMPALEAALSALDTIKPADIKLVQSFKNPPAAIKLVMEAVCVMMGIKAARVQDPTGTGKKIEDFWEPSKKLLSDSTFIQQLKTYDRDNIPEKTITTIREKYIASEDFTVEKAANAAAAAAGLAKWVFAMSEYDRAAKIVAPKKAELAIAEAKYAEVKAALDEKQAELKEVMEKLAVMEQQLEDCVAKKERLEAEVGLCKEKLERAEKLIGGLGGEKDRWTASATELGRQFTALTGDMLISAGVMGYLGAFTMPFREKTTVSWVALCKKMEIPCSPKFSLTACLGDPVKIRDWGIDGLPNDTFSIDNAIIMSNSRRWPLMIDPQGQANKWIKNMEKSDLRTIKLTDKDYLRPLENAIQFGLPVLLENVGEELDPSLEPLLLKVVFKQGGINYIQLGDNQIEFSDQFRFYITTSYRNPHYLPETAVKVTLLNFMITQDGLSDQLLGVVVAEERPDLEEQRQQLVVQSAENKRRLKEIEDRILHVLSSSQGNILEDEQAIQILSEAKVVSNEIEEKQQVADETQREIDEARRGYAPCGAFNSVLFFCIADLAGMDPMYQYSLAWFIKLFVRSIRESEKSDDLSARLKTINDYFTYCLYQNVCRSLFEKDKLLFAFLLDVRIMSAAGTLSATDYNFLLTGGVGIEPVDVAKPDASWLSPKSWGEITRAAATLSGFETLPQHIVANTEDWRQIYDAPEPEKSDFPGEYNSSFSTFQKIILLRCLRPDKVVPAVRAFVAATMGQRFIEPPPFDLEGSYRESSCVVPLLFVLSPGSDPTAALLSFADGMGYGSKIGVISMGQGQGPKAAKLIEEGRKAGSWVLLQNCHLAASWMPELERIVEGITTENTDSNFRLWLTSMPSPAFPVSMLQNGVKMTNEPPAGLRANMRRSLALDPICTSEFFEQIDGEEDKLRSLKRMVFGLVFLHAFVQERRKYGPIGWNIPYGFDDSDLRISVRQLKMYLEHDDDIPFAALIYAIGECNYGGRVTDDKDRRLLMTILRRIYRPEILEPGFNLSASGTYYIPEEGPLAHYVEYVHTLPMSALPEAFGLHENADITKDLQATDEMLSMLLVAGGGTGGGEGGQEATVAAMVKDILERLPPDFDIEKANHKYPVRYEESMNQVLCQEMLRYNRLTGVIRRSLQDLDKALQGLQVMSAELDGVFRAMSIGRVPQLWKSQSHPSLKPLASYVSDLLARLSMLQTWYEEGQPPTFWISGFFFTPSFTTAALQNYARKFKLAIDSVGFDFEFLDVDQAKYTEPPEDGVYIYGLYLEGCAWDADAKQLCESKPKQLFASAPVIWLRPRVLEDIEERPTYSCPVYRTAERRGVLATTGHSTNFLMFIDTPSDLPQHHWILRGVCMLCSLSD
ncbi:unnamed protein product [Pedinophyceae sp. YPF-701]|nr:unnamed protein product [Pedinophyceae sp. YPF-701]